jgi:hypothetical protein
MKFRGGDVMLHCKTVVTSVDMDPQKAARNVSSKRNKHCRVSEVGNEIKQRVGKLVSSHVWTR